MSRTGFRRSARAIVAVVVLVPSRVSASGSSGGDPALRRLVRALGDGTALGPAMDAVAAIGPDSFWAMLGPLLVGTAAIGLLAFGPVLGLVGLLWTYRRLRWLFWSVVATITAGVRRLLIAGGSLAGSEGAAESVTSGDSPVGDGETAERMSPGDTDVSAD